MKILIRLAISASVLAAASPAFAQDIDPTFTGPRVEGFGGVDIQKYKYQPTLPGAETKHTGGVAGVLGGFDIGVGRDGGIVAGVFGSYALPTSNFCAPVGPTSGGGCVRPEREIEGGGRIGLKMGGGLIYAKGAYVNTSIKVQSLGAQGTRLNTHVLRDGWRVGGGGEYAVTEHAYVKVEYDYTRGQRLSLDAYGYPGRDYRQTKNQVLAGFGVRF